jgi:predicted Zn finger-like uncharacterized protein
MSLATRCPACGTVFRVVQDQLRVSEGWVRCGRCEDVFNALEGLFDLEHDAPPTWGGAESAPGLLRPTQPSPLPAPVPAEPSSAAPVAVSRPVPMAQAAPEPADTEHASTQVLDTEPARRDSVAPSSHHDQFDIPLPPPAMTEVPALDAAEVGFLHRAERSARWQHPRRRAALVAAATVLAILLAAQVARERRDDIVARWPASLPLLGALCDATACRIGAPRRIEQLTVEASGLTRLDAPMNHLYRLTLTLRNHAGVGLALPQVELTLTDSQGQVNARRVLRARELGARTQVIAAGGELALQALLDGGPDARFSGYSIEIYYP